MENYNNYQDIINAIKAQYVIVRDLKRTANSRKRQINNADAFLERKDNESAVLDSRITSIKSVSSSKVNEAYQNANNFIQTTVARDLNDVRVKMNTFYAEVQRINDLHSQNPEKWEGISGTELETIWSLTGIINSTITDVVDIHQNYFKYGNAFPELKEKHKPNYEKSSYDEVRSHNEDLYNNVGSLLQSVRSKFGSYVDKSIELEQDLKQLRNESISCTQSIVDLRSQLADLLDSSAPQTQIDAKEVQIENIKSLLLGLKDDIIAKEVEVSYHYNEKYREFSIYFEILESLLQESIEYYGENGQLLSNRNEIYPGLRIQEIISEFFGELMQIFDGKFDSSFSGSSLNERIVEIYNQYSYERLTNTHLQSKYNSMKANIDSPWNNIQWGEDSRPIFNKRLGGEFWNNTFNYWNRLHQNVAGYVSQKSDLMFFVESFGDKLREADTYFNQGINTIKESFKAATRDFKFIEFEYQNLNSGRFIGTPEQNNEYQTLVESVFEGEAHLAGLEIEKDYKNRRLSKFGQLVPAFYQQLDSLTNAKNSAISYFDSVDAQRVIFETEISTAYDLLQSLTDEESLYLDALADYETKLTNFNDAVATLNSVYEVQRDEAYAYLTGPAQIGENEYQEGLQLQFPFGNGLDTYAYRVAVQSDGKILLGGSFTTYKGTSAPGIIRLNIDGSIDTSFVTGTGFLSDSGGPGSVEAMAIQPDGKIMISGAFASYNGTSANNIILLNSDGSVETFFNTGTGLDSPAYSIVLQPEGGRILMGGFSTYNGTSVSKIVRLNPNGSIDTSFVTGTGFNQYSYITAGAIQSDGKIIVSGEFSSYNGTSANRFIRLNSDGSVDSSFVTGTGINHPIYSIALQSDGKILVGGDFTSYNGTSVNRLMRLNSDGSIDTSFVTGTGFNNQINAIYIQPDGKILVGGGFTSYNGTSAPGIIRLHDDGAIEYGFAIGTGFIHDVQGPGNICSIAQTGEKTIVGGGFTRCNGMVANGIAMLLSYNGAYAQVDLTELIGLHYQYLGAQADYDAKVAQYDDFSVHIFGNVIHLEDWPLVWHFMSTVVPSLFPEVVTLTIADGEMFRNQINYVSSLMQAGYDSSNTFGWDESTFLSKKATLESSMVDYNLTYRPSNQISPVDGQHGWIAGAGGADIDLTDPSVRPTLKYLKDSAYTILMDLTDEDAAYQAALTDWNTKVENLPLWTESTLNPASVAKDEAIAAYDSFTYGDFNLAEPYFPVPASELIGYRTSAEEATNAYNEYQSTWSDINNNFINLRSNMQFVESSVMDKLQAKGDLFDQFNEKQQARERAVQDWGNHIVQLYDGTLSTLGGIRNEISWRHNSFNEETAMSYIKQFLDSSSIDNYYKYLVDQMNYANRGYSTTGVKAAYIDEAFNFMQINQVSEIFRVDTNNKVERLRSNPRYLSDTVRDRLQMYRGNAHSSFVGNLINFLETGNNF